MPIFKPIKPKRISDQVFEQIRERIFQGDLRPGEQLMPERELADTFEVSRTTVRDAISKLVALGLVEHRQGQGTFVRIPTGDDNNPLAGTMKAANATLEDVLEVRMGLECNAAALAARRGRKEDIRLIRKRLDDMESAFKHGKLYVEADVAFHMAIAFATGNPVQIHLMKHFYDCLFYGIDQNIQYLYESPENLIATARHHRKIYDQIKDGNESGAFQVMREHIQYVLDYLRNLQEHS
jgi:GntR family transcriptional repressor for pyruvate dehydrogenase complex